MNYITQIEASVQGVPVILGIKYFERHEGSGSMYSAATDLDYYGWVEYDYDVLDEEGKPAKDLEIQITEKDEDRFYGLIVEAL